MKHFSIQCLCHSCFLTLTPTHHAMSWHSETAAPGGEQQVSLAWQFQLGQSFINKADYQHLLYVIMISWEPGTFWDLATVFLVQIFLLILHFPRSISFLGYSCDMWHLWNNRNESFPLKRVTCDLHQGLRVRYWSAPMKF